MERFGHFRDAGTGLNPFVQSVSSKIEVSFGLRALQGLGFIAALLRTVVVFACVILRLTIHGISFLLFGLPAGQVVRNWASFVIYRLSLLLTGYYYIPVEFSVSLKRATGKTSLPPEHPLQGDLIVCNWSSYVELLYLSFRYNPTYLLPVVETKSNVVLGFKTASIWQMIRQCGYPPTAQTASAATSLLAIEVHLAKSLQPCCILPELTTSNNRALLPFVDLSKTANGSKIPRIFIYSFKHETPTDLLRSATIPIPSFANPLAHFFLLTANPFLPRSMLVRQLHYSEAPRGKLDDPRFWFACGEATAALARLKNIKAIDWTKKASFIAYHAKST